MNNQQWTSRIMTRYEIQHVFRIYKEGEHYIIIMDVAGNKTAIYYDGEDEREQDIKNFKEDLTHTIYSVEVYDSYEEATKRH